MTCDGTFLWIFLVMFWCSKIIIWVLVRVVKIPVDWQIGLLYYLVSVFYQGLKTPSSSIINNLRSYAFKMKQHMKTSILAWYCNSDCRHGILEPDAKILRPEYWLFLVWWQMLCWSLWHLSVVAYHDYQLSIYITFAYLMRRNMTLRPLKCLLHTLMVHTLGSSLSPLVHL